MSWREWMHTSVPCGLVTSGDIGLSNLSLVTISITFYTMVKASTPIFVLLWAYVFGIETITCNLILVVAIIATGEFLTVAGEVGFEPIGFFLCLTASMLSGMRWTLVQLKLQTMDPPLKTTITTMRLLAPSMFVSMLFLSLIVEQPWSKFDHLTTSEATYILALGLMGAFLATAMILCEFHLIMYASAIILMLGGVMKEMITIFVGVFYFGDNLNRLNLAGCFVVFLGVIFYKVTHYLDKRTREEALRKRSASDDDLSLLTGNPHHHNHPSVMLTVSGDEMPDGTSDELEVLRNRLDTASPRGDSSNTHSNNNSGGLKLIGGDGIELFNNASTGSSSNSNGSHHSKREIHSPRAGSGSNNKPSSIIRGALASELEPIV